MMRITRRGLFATIAAAVVAKSALKHLIRCECPGCQYARGFLRRGGYEFYPDAFILPNQLLTRQEITHKSLQVLENNSALLPSFYRDPA